MKKRILIFSKIPPTEMAVFLKEHHIQTLAQYNDAFEIMITEEQRSLIEKSDNFSYVFEGRINLNQIADITPDQKEIISVWNISQDQNKRGIDKNKNQGLSWGTKGMDAPRSTSQLSNDFFLKTLMEKKIPIIKGNNTRGVNADDLSKISFTQIEKKLQKKFKDPTQVYHLSRLVLVNPELEETILSLDETTVEEILNFKESSTGNLRGPSSTDEETCWRMNGIMSVGIIFVESSVNGGPVFTASERTTLRSEIQTGLNWLASQHPTGNLSWIYNYQYVKISTPDGTMSSEEDYWRNPAMGRVNYNGNTYTSNWNGVVNYRKHMRQTNNASHAIVIFVTPYGTDWHAYASSSRLTLCKRNNWGGWGINTINAITSHEVCHLFGAADEYIGNGTPCSSCTTKHGCDNVPNGNCKACAKDGGVPCIMDQNSMVLCDFTKRQIGWPAISWQSSSYLTNRAGDFDGDGKTEILVTSPWGIGLLKVSGSSMRSLAMFQNGTRLGSWTLNTANNKILLIGDFDGDGKDEILISSDQAIGILKLNGAVITSVMVANNGSRFGGWLLNTEDNTFTLSADFDGDKKAEIMVASPWGIGILKLNASSLTPLMMAANGTRFGGWLLNTMNDKFQIAADLDGDKKAELFVQSPWGIGVLKLSGNTLISPVMAANGTRFGGWLLNTNDNHFSSAADYNGDGKSNIVVSSPWGVGILKQSGGSFVPLMMAPNGSRFGGWLLNTADNRFSLPADYDGDGIAELFVSSPWGIGILKLTGTTLNSVMLKPNSTRFSGWLLNTNDNRFGSPGKYSSGSKESVFVTSPWGIGILRLSRQSMISVIIKPNGTRFGGWLLNTGDNVF